MRYKTKLFRTFFIYSFTVILFISVILLSLFSNRYITMRNENIFFINALIHNQVYSVLETVQNISTMINKNGDLEALTSEDRITRILAEKNLRQFTKTKMDFYPFIKDIRVLKSSKTVLSTSEKLLKINLDETVVDLYNRLFRVIHMNSNIKNTEIIFIIDISDFVSNFNTILHNQHSDIAYIINEKWAIRFDNEGKSIVTVIDLISDTVLEIDKKRYLYSNITTSKIIQIAYSMTSYYNNIYITTIVVILLILAAGTALFIIIHRTANSLTTPISKLSSFATSIEKGHVRHFKYKVKHIFEIQTLIKSFNFMVDEVHDFTGKLETEVINRTKVIEDQRESLEILNKELEVISVTDKLTGLFNRRSFDKKIENDFDLASRTNLYIGIGVIDIDLFKQVNDTYGHLCGDEIITKVAEQIKQSFKRTSDTIFRYGGDEFIIWSLYDKNNKEEFKNLAERTRANIEENTMVCNKLKCELNVTISTGLFFGQVKEKKDADEIIKIADEMLYKAKEQGRNAVLINS